MTPTSTYIPWLTLLIVLPLAGTLICLIFRRLPTACRWWTLISTLVILGIAIRLFQQGPTIDGWYGLEDVPWIDRFGCRWTLAMDGISLLMVLLTGFLQVVVTIISWRQKKHTALFFCLLLLLESGLLGVFLATDLVLFYLFWEMMLIPMFFLIGVWGHGQKVFAAVKFFIFTLTGSLLMLLAMIALYLLHGQQTGDYTFALEALKQTQLGPWEPWLYGGFMLAFLVKLPVVPLHTWLPDAHTMAPTAGSLDLAGLLLKTGAFGILRFAFPLFPTTARDSLPLLIAVALIGIYYAAWIAWRQNDIKRLIAYSSVSHLGVVLLGMASGNLIALQGAILLMACHGITTGAMFAVISMIHRRTGTRDLDRLGGLWQTTPVLATFFLFFALASLGLPGLANFSGEILVFAGVFQQNALWGALALPGMIFTAAYILRMVQGTLWGRRPSRRACPDLSWGELVALVPLAVMTLWLGLAPGMFLDPLHEPVKLLVDSLMATQGGLP